MKKNKILSLILCLALALSVILPAAHASAAESDSGMVISKTATANNDGTYTIKLEAYATGSKIITETTKDVPTDIVLVLDQSGSMNDPIGEISYEAYTTRTNESHYANRHNEGNANLWHKIDDNTYASVSVGVTGHTFAYTSFANQTNNRYWQNSANLYASTNGEDYDKVTVTYNRREGYIYTVNGTIIATGNRENGRPEISGGYSFYTREADYSNAVFTYTYTDANGETQTIGTSTGGDEEFGTTLYEREVNENAGEDRIVALKNAVKNFANAVAEKAKGSDGNYNTADDINHRIAVVGFSCGDVYNWQDYNYLNSEVFIGSNEYTYGTEAESVYSTAFQSMNTEAGVTNVSNSISTLEADGGTLINLGMEMANGILAANPIPSGEERNRVVVVFTDGQPGWSGYDDDTATEAINLGKTTKDTYAATVYTVGVFSGANASTAGNSDGTDTEKANWFMQQLSSNEGAVRNPSYYLSASDSATLNNIFQQISDQIETGGSSIELDETTVVKDIISDSFMLPENANTSSIKVYTADYTAANTFADPVEFTDATVDINGKDISVSNFNFGENWVGTITNGDNVEYRGKKLIIEIPIVPEPDFLGGDNVPTNGSNSGIYSGDEMIEAFPVPDTDVVAKKVAPAAQNQNIYLSTAANLPTVTNIGYFVVNGTTYTVDGSNNAYVDIIYTITDSDGEKLGTYTIPAKTPIGSLTGQGWGEAGIPSATPYDDTTYTITCEVVSTGNADNKASGSVGANVYVYKPEITFQDSQINAGELADYADNIPADSTVVWKHGDTLDTDVTMNTTKPTLDYDYSPDAGAFTEDTPVDVTVTASGTSGTPAVDITNWVTFLHEQCDFDGCEWSEETDGGVAGCEFIVHIKSFDLIITKNGVDETKDGEAPFIFNVYCEATGVDMDVVIYGNDSVTIKGLPAGTYTVTEKSGYWRYDVSEATYNPANKQVTPTGATASITITNTRTEDKWLDDFASATNKFN